MLLGEVKRAPVRTVVLALGGNLPQGCMVEAMLFGSGERTYRTGEQRDGTGHPSLVVSVRWWYPGGLVRARGGPTFGLRTKVEDVVICAHRATLDVAGLYLARQHIERVCCVP